MKKQKRKNKKQRLEKSDLDEIIEFTNSFFGAIGKAFNNFKNTNDLTFKEKVIIFICYALWGMFSLAIVQRYIMVG